jgi:ferric-dicitrate binding protein FerR (iron transport regulator)
MTSKEVLQRERLIRREASSWYWRLKAPHPSACEQEQWQRWQAVPEHQAAFKTVSSNWDRWRQMPWPRTPANAIVWSPPATDVSEARSKKHKVAYTLPLKFLTLAASMLVGIGIALLVSEHTNNRFISTGADQWTRELLTDGTILYIDARTRLRIEFTPTARIVHVYEGSAVFQVAKDAKRPFIAQTPLINAIALGTRFGLSIEQGVRTTVSEGVVQITARDQAGVPSVTLKAGEELFVPTDSLAPRLFAHVDAERKLEWSTGWITFKGETIGQAVAEFNRRNSVQIEIGQPHIAGGRIFGRFRVDSPVLFARSIALPDSLILIRDSSGKILRIRLEGTGY